MVVELTFQSKSSPVQELTILRFLGLEVKEATNRIGVLKYHLPLSRLGDIYLLSISASLVGDVGEHSYHRL